MIDVRTAAIVVAATACAAAILPASARIRMVGPYVSIWLNDRATVEGQKLDNFFARSEPVVGRGPIELQTHGAEIRFRNVYVREIPAAEANATLEKVAGAR
jgi:hypothetical protein